MPLKEPISQSVWSCEWCRSLKPEGRQQRGWMGMKVGKQGQVETCTAEFEPYRWTRTCVRRFASTALALMMVAYCIKRFTKLNMCLTLKQEPIAAVSPAAVSQPEELARSNTKVPFTDLLMAKHYYYFLTINSWDQSNIKLLCNWLRIRKQIELISFQIILMICLCSFCLVCYFSLQVWKGPKQHLTKPACSVSEMYSLHSGRLND